MEAGSLILKKNARIPKEIAITQDIVWGYSLMGKAKYPQDNVVLVCTFYLNACTCSIFKYGARTGSNNRAFFALWTLLKAYADKGLGKLEALQDSKLIRLGKWKKQN